MAFASAEYIQQLSHLIGNQVISKVCKPALAKFALLNNTLKQKQKNKKQQKNKEKEKKRKKEKEKNK
jgi:hypothetical protein